MSTHRLIRTEMVLKWGLVALSIVLVAVSAISAGPFWRDETHFVGVISRPWSLMSRWPSMDSMPLAPGTIMKAALALAPQAPLGVMRTMGFLVAAAMVLSYALVTRKLAPRSVGLLFFYLLLQPLTLRYSIETRGYGLATLFGVLTVGTYAQYAVQGGRRRLGWALFAGLWFLHANYLDCLYFLGITGVLGLLLAAGGQRRRGAIIGVAAIASLLTMVPYAGQVRANVAVNIFHFATISPSDYMRTFGEFVLLDAAIAWGAIALGLGLVACAVALAAIRLKREQRLLPCFGLGLALCTLAAHAAFMVRTGCPLMAWYYLTPTVLIVLGADIALSPFIAAWPLRARTARLAMLIPILLLPLTHKTVRAGLTRRMTNMDAVAAEVERRARQGDLVVILPFYLGNSFFYHYRGNVPFTTIPGLSDYSLQREVLATPFILNAWNGADLTPALQRAQATLRAGHRVYIVGTLPEPSPELKHIKIPRDMPVRDHYMVVMENYGHQLANIVAESGARAEPVRLNLALTAKPVEYVALTEVTPPGRHLIK